MDDKDRRWAEAFAETARAYWTPERTAELVGDKRPLILPGAAPTLLRALGLLHRDGSMPPNQVRKYRQINHMLAVLLPTLRALRERFETVRLLDAACGRSYLSTLIAWHFVHNWGHSIEIVGVDRNSKLVATSAERTSWIGLQDQLRFQAADLAEMRLAETWAAAFGAGADVHGVVSLHACDTATDEALAVAVRNEVFAVAVVPCCQAELAAGWGALGEGTFSPLWGSPHLRRATAAHVTDLFRMLLLRAAGYTADAIEFVPLEHTPKNTLIRGTRGAPDESAWAEYRSLKAAMGGVGIRLETALDADRQGQRLRPPGVPRSPSP